MKHCTSLLIAFILMVAMVSASPALAAGDSGELLAIVDQVEAGYAKVQDYTATFLKQERVEGKLRDQERISIKFMKPFKVYMKWLEVSVKEALYVQGAYSDKVQARCDGLLGLWTWSFSPRDPRLMEGNRHPITDIGFGFIIDVMRRNIPKAVERGEVNDVRITEEPFDGRPTMRVEARFTPKDGQEYYTSHMIAHIDKEHMLPVGITCYDEKGQLQEQYGYKDLKVNVGLTENDFSKGNKAYKF